MSDSEDTGGRSTEKDFTGYEQLIGLINSKYSELVSVRSDRRKMAEGRLKLVVTSAAIFTGVLSKFSGSGPLTSSSWIISITAILGTLTIISLLYTIYQLWSFLTSEPMDALKFEEDGWGGSGVFVSDKDEVDKMLKSLADSYTTSVSKNSKNNDERAKRFDRSTSGLIIYFIMLSLLTTIVILVNF